MARPATIAALALVALAACADDPEAGAQPEGAGPAPEETSGARHPPGAKRAHAGAADAGALREERAERPSRDAGEAPPARREGGLKHIDDDRLDDRLLCNPNDPLCGRERAPGRKACDPNDPLCGL